MSKRKAARASAILDAAEALIIEKAAEFEISELAKAAGISCGLAYHYFGSKDGVIEAAVQRFYARWSAVFDRRVDPDIAWRVRERARLEAVISFLYKDPMAASVFGTLSHPAVIAAEMEIQRAMIANAARNVRSGQKRRQIPPEIDSDLAGAAIIGAVRSTMAMAMRMDPRPDPERVADQLWRLIESAVRLSDR